ncbi:WXG100 family type VII secretion target [Streptomyces sp. CAU 1734]|uniref:WXG100 family type VII secretion target n=1 Tax=Streptomyces sp. CAU 1734 TaxID=3140360 RepID=UPI003261D235
MSPKDPGQMVVTYGSLTDAAAAIDRQADRLDESLEAIQTKIKVVSATFEGEAATAAHAYHKQWDTETRMIHQALKSIARAVREAAPTYQAGDKKASGYF